MNCLTRPAAIAALALTAALLTGCGSNQTADHLKYTQYDMTATASLAAGDALGAQLYASDADSTVRMAIFRTAEDAFAIAEAHEKAGTYDQWYASFIRPGEQREDGTAIAGVDVPTQYPHNPSLNEARGIVCRGLFSLTHLMFSRPACGAIAPGKPGG